MGNGLKPVTAKAEAPRGEVEIIVPDVIEPVIVVEETEKKNDVQE